jgi:hypothetical protein
MVAIHIHTKFHKDWFRHSKVKGRDEFAGTQGKIQRQHGGRIGMFLFLKIRKAKISSFVV